MIVELFALAAGALSAPLDAHLPVYAPGDAFVFSNGRVEQVVQVAADRVTWRGLSNRTYVRPVNPVLPIVQWQDKTLRGQREVHGPADGLWPLRKGNTARFRVVTSLSINGESGARSVALWRCRVEAARPVTVRAGSFTAFPVRCDRYSSLTMRPLQRLTWDYAPDIGHFIRRGWTSFLDGKSQTIELVAAFQGGSASPERLRAIVRSLAATADNANE